MPRAQKVSPHQWGLRETHFLGWTSTIFGADVHDPKGSRKTLYKIKFALFFCQEEVKFQSFSGSDLLTCMLPTFCPLTIWTISLDFCAKPSSFGSRRFLRSIRKAMNPQKPWTLLIGVSLFAYNWSLFAYS